MNDPQAVLLRRRLQELLAIPDRQRTEAQWDELNEVEIMLASVNREGAPQPGAPRPGGGGPAAHPGRHGGQGGNKPGKRFRQRPPKR